jgi:hypothetical protein
MVSEHRSVTSRIAEPFHYLEAVFMGQSADEMPPENRIFRK